MYKENDNAKMNYETASLSSSSIISSNSSKRHVVYSLFLSTNVNASQQCQRTRACLLGGRRNVCDYSFQTQKHETEPPVVVEDWLLLLLHQRVDSAGRSEERKCVRACVCANEISL